MPDLEHTNPDEAHFTPDMTVRHFINRHGITVEDIGVAPVVVISWGRSVIDELAGFTNARLSQHWFYSDRIPLFTGQVGGRSVSLVQAPVGAAGTIMVIEELIACGARAFIGLGWAGSLQPQAAIGSMLIPLDCIREEGTSFHYIDAKARVAPHPGLFDLLLQHAQATGVPVFSGLHWTTDAPYRELVRKVQDYSQQGCLGVDMETSAMYALGAFRRVRVCNLLVVSDELWREWNPAFGTDELKLATRRAQQVVLDCLQDDRLYQL